MHQRLWEYKVEQKFCVGVHELKKKLSTTGLQQTFRIVSNRTGDTHCFSGPSEALANYTSADCYGRFEKN
jgi:hypothetical protein